MPDPSAPTPPDGPRRATLRARTRTGKVRPEVIEALDELERSLGDVARWEQLLGGSTERDEWDNPMGLSGGRGRLLELDVDDIDDIEDLDRLEAEALPRHLQRAIASLDDRLDEIDAPDPLLHFSGDLPEPERDPLALLVPPPPVPDPAVSLLWQARTVEPVARVSMDEADRRRRNGRVLTWTGVALLLALGALWVLPKSDGDGSPEAPLVTITVPTPSDGATTAFAPFTTAPTIATTVASTTKATAPTTKRTTTTKATAPTSTSVAQATTSTLLSPGPPPTEPTVPIDTTTSTDPPSSSTTEAPTDG
jgi:hypothetical protein